MLCNIYLGVYTQGKRVGRFLQNEEPGMGVNFPEDPFLLP